MSDGGGGEVDIVAHGIQLGVGLDVFRELDWKRGLVVVRTEEGRKSSLVSPASPENAINVCLFKARVLSSDALRMVAPLMAAFEAAIRVKSLPVMPNKTSLMRMKGQHCICSLYKIGTYMMIVLWSWS